MLEAPSGTEFVLALGHSAELTYLAAGTSYSEAHIIWSFPAAGRGK